MKHFFLDPADPPLCTTVGTFDETCTASGILGNSVIVTVKISEDFITGKSISIAQGHQWLRIIFF